MNSLLLWDMISKLLFETTALLVEDINNHKLTFPVRQFPRAGLITVTLTNPKHFIHISRNVLTVFGWKAHVMTDN